tara:strand:+ start:418 stop:636 length:219 start_codon:yes stop_codon:yes gene_type:complete
MIEYKSTIKTMLDFPAWDGGEATLILIVAQGKLKELDAWFEGMYEDEVPTKTEINDYLAFHRDELYSNLGIK